VTHAKGYFVLLATVCHPHCKKKWVAVLTHFGCLNFIFVSTSLEKMIIKAFSHEVLEIWSLLEIKAGSGTPLFLLMQKR